MGVPSKAVSSGREKIRDCTHIQTTPEYIGFGNHVSPKSSPLQGMKAQPLQSLFEGQVTNDWQNSVLAIAVKIP